MGLHHSVSLLPFLILPSLILAFLTRSLLTTPEKRLGSRSMTEIKEHPFFHGIDWKGLYQSEPPFIPTVCLFLALLSSHYQLEDELDISYFEGVLNEEDFASLTVDEKDIEQLLTAQRHDAESFPLHLLDPERVLALLSLGMFLLS